jgi:phosphoribosylaminoimidazole carboxylase PurE protein
VAIVMGSKSDYEVMKQSAKVLADFKVSHEVRVISVHRTPDRAHEFATGAEQSGIRLIIAAAGNELKAYRKRMREDVAAADAEVRNAVFA